MKNKDILLFRTLLRSTSRINLFKYSKDKKKKGRLIGVLIGYVFLYLFLMTFCVAYCIGFGAMGMIDVAPMMCVLVLSAMSFILTILKTNGYLFGFKEYDMLMSLPFKPSRIAAAKFMYMYFKSLPWVMSISVAMMIGYGVYAKPVFYVYPLWIIMSFFIPVIPMVVSTFLGFIITKLTSGFKFKKILQTVFTIILILLIFASRFIVEDAVRNNKVDINQIISKTSEITGNASNTYLPAKWFADGITKQDFLGVLLLIGVSTVLFAIVFFIVGKSYKKINSALKSHAASKSYTMTTQKKRSVVNSVAFKEFKRMTGSPTYMINMSIGVVLAALFGVVSLIMGFDNIVSLITNKAPFDHAILAPAIPFIIYFFIGMVATTACSPSLEGKNYWIVQSLPLPKKKLYLGKILFNMYMMTPFSLFSTLCVCISAKVPVIETILYLVLGVVLCAFSSIWGCACGIKHIKLEWENEVEVVKQGAAVAVYLLPNMFIVMGLCVGVIFLGMKMDHILLASIFIFAVCLLAFLSYLRVMSLAKKQF